jgi:hypothetical protein
VNTLATLAIGTLDPAQRYRLRLRAVGTDPVDVTGWVERLEGSDWVVVAQAAASDGGATRITTAGSVGFGGYIENSYRYDNFTRLDLGGDLGNPVPVVSTLSPDSVIAGSGDLTLTVTGSGFISDSVVRWNGADRLTTFISDTVLEAFIAAADTAADGTASVAVYSPGPGGGVSNTQPFTIGSGGDTGDPTALQIDAITPASTLAGSSGVTVSVTGSGFSSNSVVRWNGQDRPTTYISPSELQANLSAADLALPQVATITVNTPAGPTSGPTDFFVLEAGSFFFSDNFNRPDNPDLGNGWVEKDPDAWSLLDGQVFSVDQNSSYQANIAYRPLAEDLRDVEVGLEFIRTAGVQPFPQVHARAQRDTLDDPLTLHSYLLFIDEFAESPGRAMIALSPPVPDSPECYMRAIPLPEPLVVGDRYRLRLTLIGQEPVVLTGVVEHFDGEQWQLVASGTTTHDSTTQRDPDLYCFPGYLPPPINNAGTFGFAQWFPRPDRYDSFYWMSRPTATLPPTLTQLSPSNIQAGSDSFELVVNGTGFTADSVLRWNEVTQTTTFVSDTELRATISAADISAPGDASVTVYEPISGTSAVTLFAITELPGAPVPVLSGLTPATVLAGGSDFTLTVTGSGYTVDSVVRWDGSDRATTFVSEGELQALIPASDIASAGTAPVTVFTPTPGGGESAALTVTTDPLAGGGDNPVPVLGGLTPDSVIEGSGDFVLTVTGSDFVPDSVVLWNGIERTTTFVSSGELQAFIAAADVATAGSAVISVSTPSPGGGEAVTQSLAIIASGGTYIDTFSVSDGEVLGGGWIEKSPGSFAIVGGEVIKQAVSSGYRDNLVYRPASEDLLDVEASVELRVLSNPPGYPQIMVRVQSATVGTANVLDGYLLYINNGTGQAVLSRQTGSASETTLATMPIGTLDPAQRYRLRLRAIGTDPVVLTAWVERLTGSAWEVVAQVDVTDSTAARIATGGSVGFGGYIEGSSYVFDNFIRVDLSDGTGNPVPVASVLTPDNVLAGGSDFTLTVTGSGFTPGSVVRWNGADRITTYISGSELWAFITLEDIADPGTASVTVSTPPPGGGLSAPLDLTIETPAGGNDNPVPVLTGLTPGSVFAGDGDFVLTVTGSDFVPESIVLWNGVERTTTFVSAGELQAFIPASDVAAPGSAVVSVSTPAPGGGESASQSLPILASGITYLDAFDYPDGDALGGGWIEKSAGAFAIAGGQVVKQAVSTGYRDNLVYRPASEDLLDVEAAVELEVLSNPPGYAQIMVRVQSATVGTANVLDGYILYLNDGSGQAVLGRQNGAAFVNTLATLAIGTLDPAQRYRLRLRAVGTDPVDVTGWVERLEGSDWVVVAQGTATDGAAARIATAGSVGFGGFVENSYRYDNFTRVDLGP